MIDTHCHLNFKAFEGKVDEAIKRAEKVGVGYFVVPGTDVPTSKKAVELAEKYPNVVAAVGIHPHHVFQYQKSNIKNDLKEIEKLLQNKKVVAVGEVGLDRHYYNDTKYKEYRINNDFMDLQKILFKAQIKLAMKYKKSLIIHTRETAGECLEIIGDSSILDALKGSMVFHCCEADNRLLEFALAHQIYIGVDGDVTYNQEKQEFVKKIPLELILLETDSPFLLPEPLRSKKLYPNEPKNIVLIADTIARLKNISIKRLIEATTKNAKKLFQVD